MGTKQAKELDRMAGILKFSGLLGFSSGKEKSSTRNAQRDAAKAISLCKALLSEGGEAAGTRLASEALGLYASFDDGSKDGFFDLLASQSSPAPNREAILRAAEAYRKDQGWANLQHLGHAVESPRQELFRRLNTVPGGTHALVHMRADLLRSAARNDTWEPIAADLSHLLSLPGLTGDF